ncbi:MAG: hypothetical protein ACO2PO_07960 [Candidatus Calescibacterium sp.]
MDMDTNISIGLARVSISNVRYLMDFQKNAVNQLLSGATEVRPIKISTPEVRISTPEIRPIKIGNQTINLYPTRGNMIRIRV